ncbi:ADP-ribosyl cyclase/cyclic ADP-ribose hydrolase-like [Ptychodera flava]|uniref:ADP-ribosyl cyclase/cyclic ADP-ribose hydrolase-like n=1 Tax=Ptychodera flava TaxID=63121 RepID=UPI00396A909B
MMGRLTLMYVCLLFNLILDVQFQIATARRTECESSSSTSSTTFSTPWELEKIFKDRCHKHVNSCPFSTGKNCDDLWNTFHDSFAYKDPCINESDYTEYFNKAKHYTRKDKTLFYSGVQPYEESHKDPIPYTTLENTLIGNMLDKVDTWCGKYDDQGINYVQCPDRNYCMRPLSTAKCAFWIKASIEFAQLATGQVQVLLDGAKKNGDPAYDSDSFFSRYELPHLNTEKVTMVNILVMYSTKKSFYSVVAIC